MSQVKTTINLIRLSCLFSILLLLMSCAPSEQDHKERIIAYETKHGIESYSSANYIHWQEKTGCHYLSTLFYDGNLITTSQESKKKREVMPKQSVEHCEQALKKSPESLELKLKLLGSRLAIRDYYASKEIIESEKLEETVLEGIADGNPQAYFMMALLVTGSFINDETDGHQWLKRAMTSKNPELLVTIGDAFKDERSYDIWLATSAYKKAYNINKDLVATYELGLLNMKLVSEPNSAKQAIKYLHEATDRGSPMGYFFLGLLYSELTKIGNDVEGFEKDESKALEYFEKDLKNGGETSASALITTYLDDELDSYNEIRGVELYCLLEEHDRPKHTVYSRKPININCDTKSIK